MEQKLTAQIAAAYLSDTLCFYANCIKREVCAVAASGHIVDKSGIYYLAFACQLELRELKDIAEADATEVAKILEYPSDILETAVDTEMVVEHLEDVFSNNNACFSDYVPGNKLVSLLNFLRSKGYDCDNLIQSGIAIKKPHETNRMVPIL